MVQLMKVNSGGVEKLPLRANAVHSSSRSGSSDVESPEEDEKVKYTFQELYRTFAYSYVNGACMSTFPIAILPTEAARVSAEYKTIILAGLLTTAGCAQLAGPIAGLYSDRSTNRKGKRRPFMYSAATTGSLGLILMLTGSHYEIWPLYCFAFLITMLSLNTTFASMVGLVADLIREEQNGSANGVVALHAGMGALSGFGMWFLFDGDTRVMYMFFLCILFLAIFSTATAPIKEIPQEDVAQPTWKDIRSGFWVSPTKHRDFFIVFIGRMLYYMGISSTSFFLYYLKDMVHAENPELTLSMTAVVGLAGSIMTAYPSGKVSDSLKNGRIIYIYISSAVMAAGMVLFIMCESLPPVFLIMGLIGGGQGCYQTMDYCLALDSLPNKKEAARFMGVWGVAAFVGSSLGPTIGGPTLFYFGQTEVPGEFSRKGYAFIWCIGAFYLLVSAFVLRYLKNVK